MMGSQTTVKGSGRDADKRRRKEKRCEYMGAIVDPSVLRQMRAIIDGSGHFEGGK